MSEVVDRAEARAHRPARALAKDVDELLVRESDEPARTDAGGNALSECIHELAETGRYFVPDQTGRDEPHAAVDVEANPTRGDHARLGVHGRHAANREPIAPVCIGHGEARFDDPWQRRDVRGLDEHLVVHLRHELLAAEDPHGNPHPFPEAAPELETCGADPSQ